MEKKTTHRAFLIFTLSLPVQWPRKKLSLMEQDLEECEKTSLVGKRHNYEHLFIRPVRVDKVLFLFCFSLSPVPLSHFAPIRRKKAQV